MKHLNIRWGEWLRSAGECCLLAASSDFARGLNWDAVSAIADLMGLIGAGICLVYFVLQVRPTMTRQVWRSTPTRSSMRRQDLLDARSPDAPFDPDDRASQPSRDPSACGPESTAV